MKQYLSSFVIAFTLFMFCAQPAIAAPLADKNREGWPTHLRFLSGPAGGQWFHMGTPIADILSAQVLPTTSRIGGGISNINNINNKTGDLGFTLISFLSGTGSNAPQYKDIKRDNVVLMANVYPQVLYFLIRKDFAERHNITTVNGLLELREPVRFASLKPGTASEFILSLLLEYGYGINFDELRARGWQIYFNNYAETADKFTIGELDCFAYTAGTNVPLIHTMESHTPVMVLAMQPEVLALMSEKFGTYTYVIKPGSYSSVSQPTSTLGDFTALMVREDLPESLVYAICRALWQNRAKVSEAIKDFAQLTPQQAVSARVPMHPGAMRFWREALQTSR